ncbi:NAD(P)-binding domain-containing protein [Planococcus sp. ISL-110]|uniref:NAD(P)-binding domain-containing protein n=1 Tax=Planococcus sp. ISL-110 TaxID=2819167 RepID=UPI001BEC0A33|nr:NAD(P)-binding domain-containing protein [Planococcus sp. ISL-110]MBT2570732.1 NAD(P)-binding domain-containing protein [Planococcus sp. ISL-110]
MKSTEQKVLPIGIIGAGPIGLAAAAHLHEQGLPFYLFEIGKQVGSNFLDYKHVRLFSPWKFNVDPASREILKRNGWTEPVEKRLPYAGDIYTDYLYPLSQTPELEPHIYLNAKVVSIGRKHIDKSRIKDRSNNPFIIKAIRGGALKTYEVRAVIDASGTWQSPNPLMSGGYYSLAEEQAKDAIMYGIPDILGKDKERYEGKHTLVVGSGHSAINTVIQLGELKKRAPETTISWVIRKPDFSFIPALSKNRFLAQYRLGEKIEQLMSKESIECFPSFYIEDLTESNGKLDVIAASHKRVEGIDQIVVNTGARPNIDIFREVQYSLHSSAECVEGIAQLLFEKKGVVQPHGEKQLRHMEEGFYIIGSKSFGRSSSFFLMNGFEQARSIAAYLSGKIEESEEVHIKFPDEWLK